MAPKTVNGNKKLAEKIKARRQELGLTIEEAARLADVGMKTWSRYEAGESIRKDKIMGVIKALNWKQMPDLDTDDLETIKELEMSYFVNGGAWSTYLQENFSEFAAIAFAAGSEALLNEINDDLRKLAKLPKGTHIGQLNISMLIGMLPEQFLMDYDYEFLYELKMNIGKLQSLADDGEVIAPASVLDELSLYLISEESELLMASFLDDDEDEEFDTGWIFDLLEDSDVIDLYSGTYMPKGSKYHFDRWSEEYDA